MFRKGHKIFKKKIANQFNGVRFQSQINVPDKADVVIIGGGSAGCHTFYHLTKKGVKAVLLERAQLTAGTTWHTAGLVWRLRPNDVDIELLASSRNMLKQLENETGLDPGWIQNGGIFIAHSKNRLDEYKRLASIGNSLGIENHILTPSETKEHFPLINEKSFIGSLYSPGDGVVDPAMLCTALTRAAGANGGKLIENCPVQEILVEDNSILGKKVIGVSTPYGNIKTDTIVNATGVWGQDLIEKHGIKLPLIPMRHAYVVSEPIPGVRGLPNLRDHDYSIYFRIQGESICMGGYENNPILLDKIPETFNFGLYELDWSSFDIHVSGTISICPAFGKYGVKSTVCGPESFTPDHKPLMGPDPNLNGLFHNCGFNSAGMMFGGGCGEQIASWIINGQPDFYMFQFDIRRFTSEQNRNLKWCKERSHESYAKNYSMVFTNDQPLAGRNFQKDPIHDDMIKSGAIMQEKQGWERPGFFMDNSIVLVQPYDWYGNYDNKRNTNLVYEEILEGDLRYEFSEHHDLIGKEALFCRNNAVVFNMCYFAKMYLDGPDSKKAADWIFTSNTNRDINKKMLSKIKNFKTRFYPTCFINNVAKKTPEINVPKNAEVVIIGGGSAGCHTLYQLAKKGVKAVLLERAQLTSGTTWHTAGLVWSFRTGVTDMQLLAKTRNIYKNLKNETGLDPGWIQNGSIFVAHSNAQLEEYKLLSSFGNTFGIKNSILTPTETKEIFPLLDETSFIGSLYSPGDGVIDPAMLCTALTRSALLNGGKFIENCPVQEILVETNSIFGKKIFGVSTPYGIIKTDTVVNATGVWGQNLVEQHDIKLPLIPMRHAYVVSESIPEVRGLPNVRDHNFDLYFRIQGESICMGGYENNPIVMNNIPEDFHFGLYSLDWSLFDSHINRTVELCPAFAKAGIKSTICGPESFTPDRRPLIGPDPNLYGLYHNCGYSSAGMMLGGGCGEQLASWIINGQPDLHMFTFDVRRFTKSQNKNNKWILERSCKSYSKSYKMQLNDNDYEMNVLYEDMLKNGGVFKKDQNEITPEFFIDKNIKFETKDISKSQFPEFHYVIRNEAIACRNNAVVFNLSNYMKLYLDGPDAKDAINWIFTEDIVNEKDNINKTIYTCVLNNRGGVEADVTVSKIESGTGEIHNPIINGTGYYIVAGGASAYYTYCNILSEIKAKKFQANLKDVTSELGVLSIQGPKSQEILKRITNIDFSNSSFPPNSSKLISIGLSPKEQFNVRILRVSFVGELGYELHIPNEYCSKVYHLLMEAGKSNDLKNAGYRALYSLSSEKGYHLWGFDLRTDDTPIEANLGFTCRKNGDYKGKEAIDKQRKDGIKKRLVYFTLKDHIPIWGLEGVYRNGEPVGHLRRGEYAYTLDKPFGQAYIERKDGQPINDEFIESGNYQIDIMGKLYDANCYLRSPFDPEGKRILGIY